MRTAPLLLALPLWLAAACQTAPTASVPEPLPEALGWAAPAAEGDGVFLGLKVRENDSGSLDALFFDPGVRVARVVESSPAAAAGFEVGDVLLEWAGREVNDPAALEALVQESAVGPPVAARVRRGDTVFEVPVVLRSLGGAPRPEPEVLYRVDPSRSRAGWATGRGGAVLVSSLDEAPFPSAGVPVGSTVTAVDGREVHSARALIRLLETYPPGEKVEVRVVDREGVERDVKVELVAEPRKVTHFMIPILTNYDSDPDGESTSFVLIDLYVISLFRYTREGAEKEWRFLRWFQWSTGIGELSG